MADVIETFAEWFKQRYQDVKHLTADQIVAEFKRQQQIREDNQAEGK